MHTSQIGHIHRLQIIVIGLNIELAKIKGIYSTVGRSVIQIEIVNSDVCIPHKLATNIDPR